jgi:hypothetical protein
MKLFARRTTKVQAHRYAVQLDRVGRQSGGNGLIAHWALNHDVRHLVHEYHGGPIRKTSQFIFQNQPLSSETGQYRGATLPDASLDLGAMSGTWEAAAASNGVKCMMAGGSHRCSRSGEVAPNHQKNRGEQQSKKRHRQHELAKS